MPIFTPSRRWQPAFYPFKKRRFSEQIEECLERAFKGILWGCRMCGNCLLQETAFICPMACPKGLRNGPCGGSTPEHCCVDDSRPCIWYAIFTRAEKMGRLDLLLEILPPLDWDKTGTSALRDVSSQVRDNGVIKTLTKAVLSPPDERKDIWDQIFKEIRQPDWWAGDSEPHPAPFDEPISRLENTLARGKFALTCEVIPPATGDFTKFDDDLSTLKGLVDAVNITDGASALTRTSPLISAERAVRLGLEPVLQMAARDRTRISFQADLIGASAVGIRNILLISGDHPNKGVQPFSKMDIWDYDSIQAIWMARKIRDEGLLLDGRQINEKPSFFIGAAAAPFASKPKYQAIRAEKKVNAGAQFLQTNLVYDLDTFEAYLEALEQRNVLNRVHLIAGIAPIRNIKALKYLSQLPGIKIPENLNRRLIDTKDVEKESHQICLELIEKVISIPGVKGIHFMAIKDVSKLKRLILESSLRVRTTMKSEERLKSRD
jgi:methylenetetrahydrofolate reductase (NADPH)